jgi:branched-chain amino acid transport system substrate-binding protein
LDRTISLPKQTISLPQAPQEVEMRFEPRRTRNLTAALGIMVAVAACSQPAGGGGTSASSAGAGKSELRIGYVLPETGGIAFLGPGMIGSVKLAVDDINAAGESTTCPSNSLGR